MRVVFDTNIYAGPGALFSGSFKTFVKARLQTGHTLYVPQIVYDEVIGRVRRAIDETQQVVDAQFSELKKVLPREVLKQVEINYEKLLFDYKALFNGKLQEAGEARLAYPRVSHDVVVQRAIERRRPFDTEGKAGYRDTLIWETVLELLGTDPHTPIAFVSNNTEDFADDKDKTKLHPHLLADIRALGIANDAIEYFTTLEAFNAKHIVKELELLDNISQRLLSGTYDGLDLRSFLVGTFVQTAGYPRITADQLGIPFIFTNGVLAAVKEVSDITDVEARRLSSQQIVISFAATVTAEFRFRALSRFYQTLPERLRTLLPATKTNDAAIESNIELACRLAANITYNTENRTVESAEVSHLQSQERDRFALSPSEALVLSSEVFSRRNEEIQAAFAAFLAQVTESQLTEFNQTLSEAIAKMVDYGDLAKYLSQLAAPRFTLPPSLLNSMKFSSFLGLPHSTPSRGDELPTADDATDEGADVDHGSDQEPPQPSDDETSNGE